MIAVDPPKRLEMTFLARWDPEMEAEGPVRQVWELEAEDGAHEAHGHDLRHEGGSKTAEEFSGGIVFIVSGLKSLVEGAAAAVPAG